MLKETHPDHSTFVVAHEGPGKSAETKPAKTTNPKKPDWAIASDVRGALRFSLGLKSSKVTVAVHEGVASLSGSLDYEVEKTAALGCVATVGGLVSITDHIELSSVFVARP